MTAPVVKVECDHCGHRVRIREDGTVGVHRYTHNRQKVECEHSGRRYAFHMGTFRVERRGPDGKGILWLVECRCGEARTGATHEDVVSWHAGHVSTAYVASQS